MSPQTKALLDAALALPDEERGILVDHLLESLGEPDEEFVEVTEEEFVAELQRRAAEMADGSDPGITWSDLAKEQ
jgi:putative addiction module component (TIGR02574 family)